MMSTVAPGQSIVFEAVFGSDADTITFAVTTAGGATVVAATPYGISHVAAGAYLYSWPVPADQAAGTYQAAWHAVFSGIPQDVLEPFDVSPAGGSGAWCTPAEVQNYANAAVTQADVNIAQAMLEALTHRVWRATDAATRDFYWLTRATAFQAAYVAAHPELLTMMDVSAISQDGLSISFKNAPSSMAMYSPIAQRFLEALYRGSNTTIRLNSAFQKNRRRTAALGAGATIPWTNL